MCSFGRIHDLSSLTLLVIFSLITSIATELIQVRNCSDATGPHIYALDFIGLVEEMGRKAEEYTVTTEDGYILKLFRIPPNPLSNRKRGIPVYFQHAFLCSADMYLLRGTDLSLPIIFSDAGYDVWLGNARGTTYGRKHLTLSTDDYKFWDFSLDDHALKDLPANIDFVLQATNSTSLSFIGMSMGTLTPKILLAEKPEYNRKINVFINLASVSFLKLRGAIYDLIYTAHQFFLRFLPRAKPYEVFSQNGFGYDFVHNFCLSNYIYKKGCLWLMHTLCGDDYDQSLEPHDSIRASRHLPAGTSTKVLLHFVQLVLSGKFRYYDYEDEVLNMKHYGQPTPPDYNISNITAPIVIFHGQNDAFSPLENDMTFISKLPVNRTLVYEVISWKKFNHLDYVLARDVKTMLFDKLIEVLDDFTTQGELQQNII